MRGMKTCGSRAISYRIACKRGTGPEEVEGSARAEAQLAAAEDPKLGMLDNFGEVLYRSAGQHAPARSGSDSCRRSCS